MTEEIQQSKGGSIKKIVFPIILVGVLGFGAWYGYTNWQFNKNHISTDNAQIDGNINPLIPRMPGYVTQVNFSDNQMVEMGDTLVVLDNRDILIRIQQAEAAVENAIANVNVVKANVKAAKANSKTAQSGIDVAKAGVDAQDAAIEAAKIRVWKANEDYKRFSNLLAEGTVTQQVFDGIKAEKEASEKQLEILQKQKEISKKQQAVSYNQSAASSEVSNATAENIAVAEAGVKARRGDLEMAKLSYTYSFILAPASGKISKKNVQIGQFIQPGQSLGAIVNDKTQDLWVIANFKETQVEKMREGQEVDIEIDAFKGKKLKGKVQSISPATGAKFALLPPDNASGNFVKVVQRVPIKILITENKDNITIRPGMNVKATVKIN
ncbi:MAG: HlyD family secretion protein [Chitinophagales bacterium]|nr:HlyD family secretion protein [Chitinophagales bacterium]